MSKNSLGDSRDKEAGRLKAKRGPGAPARLTLAGP